MDVPTIQKKALEILSDLNKVRTEPQNSPAKEPLWAKIVHDMKGLPRARPGLRHVYCSSLKRAAKTAEMAALTANNTPFIHATVAIKEIQLGRNFDEDLIQQSEDILIHAHDATEALDQLKELYKQNGLSGPLTDTTENRQLLSNPTTVFHEGDSTQGYAARVIKGYAAILLHALEEGPRTVEDIAATLPDPSPEFIQHVFNAQIILQKPEAERAEVFNPNIIYAPFTELCTRLAKHRVVLARHGDTPFSKQKILTGGHIDAGLIDEGKDAAIETGILLKLYNKSFPNDIKIIQIFGHSAASSIVEATLCVSSANAHDPTTGQYKVAEPHIFDFNIENGFKVTAVSRKSLAELLEKELSYHKK